MSTCQICNTKTPDGRQLCRDHRHNLNRWLNETTGTDKTDAKGNPQPGLIEELDTAIARLHSFTAAYGVIAGHEIPLPWNEPASQARANLEATLAMWVYTLAPHINPPDPPPASTIAAAQWLERNINPLTQHNDAGQAYSDIKNAVDRARKTCDRPDMRAQFFVGPCPELSAPGRAYCPGEIWAYIPDAEDQPAVMRCTRHPECPAEWDTTRWLRAGRRILARRAQLDQQCA